ncbi:prophage tail fiber N-terminal domain-containing protein [Rahnella sp. PCH160]|uniref:prophage tail fiber N-terminal domain-containing protein n=1 Tax=Rahnella sp. PCH160 TaxID=3447928 RepID=UPI0039FBAA77
MPIISGILKAPNGQALAAARIVLNTLSNYTDVTLTADSITMTGADGSYSIPVTTGYYSVSIIYKNIDLISVGKINILPTSPDGTLNEYLLANNDPIYVQYVLSRLGAPGDISLINGAIDKAQNLNDVANKATARANLGVDSKAESQASSDAVITSLSASDGVTMPKSKNLADVENAVVVRQNIGVYSEDDLDKTIAQLKGFEDIQAVRLSADVSTQYPTVNLNGLLGDQFVYDSTDTSSADDGWSILVTSDQKRLKRVFKDSIINLRMMGLKPAGDLYASLTKAIAFVDAYVLANGFYGAPVIAINAGAYTLSAAITMPSWVRIVAYGNVKIDATAITTGSIWSITNTVAGVDTTFHKGDNISSIGGQIYLQGPAQSASSSNGLFIGNTSSGKSGCRNVRISNLAIRNTNYAVCFGSIDTYLTTLEKCHFEYNNANWAAPSSASTNSGERMNAIDCIFGHMLLAHIYINMPAMDTNFIGCSFDFGPGDVFLLGATATYLSAKVSQSHFEQWGGYLVNSPVTALSNSIVMMHQVIFLARPDASVAATIINSPSRLLTNGDTQVLLDSIDFRHEYPAYTEDIFASTSSRLYMTNYFKDAFRQIPSPYYILNRGYDFSSEVVGTDLATGTFVRFAVASRSQMTGSVTARSDGRGNQLSVTSAADNGFLTLAGEKFPCQAGNIFYVYGAIQPLSATGSLQMQSSISWYDSAGALISTTSSTYSQLMRDNFNNTDLPNYSQGTNRYMASNSTQLVCPAGAVYGVPRVLFSKFTGAFNISRLACAKVA